VAESFRSKGPPIAHFSQPLVHKTVHSIRCWTMEIPRLFLFLLCGSVVAAAKSGDVAIPEEPSYIVGGVDAPPGKYPYYAIPSSNIVCGATLIHEDILITAAHCNSRNYNFLSQGFFSRRGGLYIGPSKLDGSDAIEQIGIKLIRVHPDYDPATSQNDIVLIKLSRPSTAPVVKWNDNPAVPGNNQTVTTIGFGTLSSGGVLSSTLKEVNVPIVSPEACTRAYDDLDKDTMICAGSTGKDSCQGDSGGPLFHQGVLVGGK
jgi:secreted trypsin-like serine protease